MWAETGVKLLLATLKPFQSTPPVWAETKVPDWIDHMVEFQSTPPVWAETASHGRHITVQRHFNPLRPCGRRPPKKHTVSKIQTFQSTPPVWAETRTFPALTSTDDISIHSARVGGDLILRIGARKASGFQSTPPVWAETSKNGIRSKQHYEFQSTPPVWAET